VLAAVGLGIFLSYASVAVLLNTMGQQYMPKTPRPISHGALVQTHASGD
jgi:hypothetical protein